MTYQQLNDELLRRERAIELAYERGLYNDELEMREHLDKLHGTYSNDVQWLNMQMNQRAA